MAEIHPIVRLCVVLEREDYDGLTPSEDFALHQLGDISTIIARVLKKQGYKLVRIVGKSFHIVVEAYTLSPSGMDG